MDVFAGEANVGGCWLRVLFENARQVVANPCDLATVLRGVVFVGEPPLGLRFNLKRVGLRAG